MQPRSARPTGSSPSPAPRLRRRVADFVRDGHHHQQRRLAGHRHRPAVLGFGPGNAAEAAGDTLPSRGTMAASTSSAERRLRVLTRLHEVDVYDLATNQWTDGGRHAARPWAPGWLPACGADGRIYAAGGRLGSHQTNRGVRLRPQTEPVDRPPEHVRRAVVRSLRHGPRWPLLCLRRE